MKKRKQKNQSTLNEELLDATNSVNATNAFARLVETAPDQNEIKMLEMKSNCSLMDNSMSIGRNTTIGMDGDDDSFLEMERQCQLDEQRQRLLEAEVNNTLLADIEPPPELWEDSLLGQSTSLQHSHNDDNSVQLTPMRMVGLTRPSTIVEETSSQCNSTGEKSQNYSHKNVSENRSRSLQSSTSTHFLSMSDNSIIEIISPSNLAQDNQSIECDAETSTEAKNKRETIFKKRKYKFFKEENDRPNSLAGIEPSDVGIESPQTPAIDKTKMISLEQSPFIACETPERDQFNDTIEAMDFFIEKGKRLLERTPQAKIGTIPTNLETPLFSCKRTRILSEMAAAEMQPIPKRGPLLDLYFSPDTTANPNANK